MVHRLLLLLILPVLVSPFSTYSTCFSGKAFGLSVGRCSTITSASDGGGLLRVARFGKPGTTRGIFGGRTPPRGRIAQTMMSADDASSADWRSFRAKLVAQEQGDKGGGDVEEGGWVYDACNLVEVVPHLPGH